MPIVFFFTGLLLDLGALFADHASELPLVMRLIAPAYSNASAGLQEIAKGDKLGRGDEGFKELEAILLTRFREDNDTPTNITDLKIEQIWIVRDAWRGNQPIEAFATVFYSFTTAAHVVDFGGRDAPKQGNRELVRLKEEVENLKHPNVTILSFVMFGLGTSLAITGFFMDRQLSRREKNDQEKRS